ncbi:hypothetical protein AFZ52_14505 [Listeria monocytogenes]|uniref:Uncharacterized protein n=5 Tax=Listeria TaxID=1637 RepID=D7V1E8_LISGR|nr:MULTISPECIES: hypothetical protein [Listeria]EFI82770.1 hypothetical protein HMPREF0556_plasmid12573 [Listeria grayi DSM 20601]ARJ94056.1 hypothetical protein ABY78_15540 [Listeria monocytogenes]ASD77540.1 hypothetical protein ARX15_16015 [Listeria monocytogenes]KES26744.1 hypothetical protein HR64_14960 [Listeria monocytogenes]KES34557.1 hypothetical protein HS07_15050 [Listeria monocytogenes]
MQPTQIYWQICTKCLWNEFLSFKEKNYKPKIEWRMYMLDSNTDRLLWTVVTVVVVGAILLIVKTAFPELVTDVISAVRSKLTAGAITGPFGR